MAIETRREAAALKKSLLDNGHRYGFYQAYRLLRLLAHSEGSGESELRIRPQLSLGFQESDINQIVERQSGGFDLTVNFLGLYGVSSPLPTFYSEDLIDDAHEDRHGQRDFLDILNQTLYPLFFKAWLKTKPQLRLVEFNDQGLLEVFYKFVGLLNPKKYLEQPGSETLLRFAGLYAQNPRSASGLKTIVSGTYPKSKIDIIQLDVRIMPIATDQRCKLGVQANELGQDSHLGSQIANRTTNITIRIADLDEKLFHELLPGQLEYKRLQFMVRYYLIDPLEVRLELGLRKSNLKGARLSGDSWSRLGNDTWLPTNNNDFYPNISVSL